MFIDGTDETDNLNLPFHSEYRHTVYINSGAVYVHNATGVLTVRGDM